MKLLAMELPFGRNQTHKMSTNSMIVLLMVALSLLVLFIAIPLNNHFSIYTYNNNNNISESPSSNHFFEDLRKPRSDAKCDIFTGEWLPNPGAPYYTNRTCWAIHEHQNCMKYGRPDSEFMKWKWKPYGCELPIFDPIQFLELMRGKSLAIVGDSVARNQLQSLICLLSRVEYPVDISHTRDEYFKHWIYSTYNFTLASFWTTHLVRSIEADPIGPTNNGLFNLYLDEFDEKWTTQIDEFDYLIISSGHWFDRPLMYYEKGRLIGCSDCQLTNVTNLPIQYGFRRAFNTAFRAINSLENFKGVTLLRTFAPGHFENGKWDTGGNCVRQRPFRRNETVLEGQNWELYRAQVEEFRAAEREGKERELKFRLLDATQAMLLRPDGHPSRFGHWPNENVKMYNDCVHWCLPGPIDTWNDLLLEMLRTGDI